MDDPGATVTVWLAGDVMTGRGIDQIQRHHVDPLLHEPWVRDARDYLRLAESVSGSIPAPVDPAYIWGEALAEIDRRRPDFRLINLETAITDRGQPWPGKGIHYRMHPANVACLAAARPDCCALANNHLLDWGREGLSDTIAALDRVGIAHAGAGADAVQALSPAVFALQGGGRLLVFSCASADSGVMPGWQAGPRRSGVALLDAIDGDAAQRLAERISRWRRPGDLVILSIHWGGNWGARPAAQRGFARRLIDLRAIDLLHGHSSHHPRPFEVWRGRLIVYGCGDLINDYEGIGREGGLDPSAVCLWFAMLARDGGELRRLEIVPMRLRRFRLVRADEPARAGLHALLAEPGSTCGLEDLSGGGWVWR